MSYNFKLTEEEKKKIKEKHESAKKDHVTKKEELKKGLQKPDKKTSN